MWKALIKLIDKWSYRCDHTNSDGTSAWEQEIAMKTFTNSSDKMPHTIKVTYRCTKCCEFKSRKL